jgi:hypothetical protein
VVPLELVSPPLPMDRLGEIENSSCCCATPAPRAPRTVLGYAFGLQFNPEIPSEDPAVITAYLKAFLCLYEWLFVRADINLTRRITSYIDPFPTDYVRKVIAPDYGRTRTR